MQQILLQLYSKCFETSIAKSIYPLETIPIVTFLLLLKILVNLIEFVFTMLRTFTPEIISLFYLVTMDLMFNCPPLQFSCLGIIPLLSYPLEVHSKMHNAYAHNLSLYTFIFFLNLNLEIDCLSNFVIDFRESFSHNIFSNNILV